MKSQFRHDLTRDLRAAHRRQVLIVQALGLVAGLIMFLVGFAAGQVAAFLTTP